jgi:F-type H+-transporting ATPase subunit epsilon
MQLEVLSFKGVVVSCEVSSVILPGVEGAFGIWPGHTPFISILKQGKLSYFNPGLNELDIEGGYVKIKDDFISVCLNN